MMAGNVLVILFLAWGGSSVEVPQPSSSCRDDGSCAAKGGARLLQTSSLTVKQAVEVMSDDIEQTDDGGVEDCKSDVGQVHEFTVDGKTRCFNIVTPTNAQKPMPVVVFFHGFRSRANAACKANTELVTAANDMGFALLCADALVDWQFPKVDGELGVNSDKPQPCTSEDTPDVDYVQKFLDTIQADKSAYDATRIYFQGFSQGAMMTTWASTCFASQIRGASQAGSGLKVGGVAVTEEWCAGSSSTRCSVGSTDGNNIPGGACPTSSSCEYFPIKPTKLKNVVGEDLNWCLYAGCSDYLLGSVLSQAQQQASVGAPHTLTYYDSDHKAPSNWMPKVAQCHNWPNAPQVDETPWLGSCDGVDLLTNDGKYCLGETGCGGGGGGGGGVGGDGGGDGGGSSCPKFCLDAEKKEMACKATPCAACKESGDLVCDEETDADEENDTDKETKENDTGGTCEDFCARNPREWDTKCTWKKCRSCDECTAH